MQQLFPPTRLSSFLFSLRSFDHFFFFISRFIYLCIIIFFVVIIIPPLSRPGEVGVRLAEEFARVAHAACKRRVFATRRRKKKKKREWRKDDDVGFFSSLFFLFSVDKFAVFNSTLYVPSSALVNWTIFTFERNAGTNRVERGAVGPVAGVFVFAKESTGEVCNSRANSGRYNGVIKLATIRCLI